jgi:hypothetical protein
MGYLTLCAILLLSVSYAPAALGEENTQSCRKEIVGLCPSPKNVEKFGVACVRNLSQELITEPCREYLQFLKTKLLARQAKRTGNEKSASQDQSMDGISPHSTQVIEQGEALDPDQALLIIGLIGAASCLLLAAIWKISVKMGMPGYYGLIPIFGWYCWLKAMNKPLWWLLAMMVPFVGLLFSCMFAIALAKAFGKSSFYGVVLSLFPPLLIKLAFDGSQFSANKIPRPAIPVSMPLKKAS